jgi:SAM-dependent methyltransferase
VVVEEREQLGAEGLVVGAEGQLHAAGNLTCMSGIVASRPRAPYRACMPDFDEVNAAERKRWNDEDWVAIWLRRESMTHRAMPMLLDALELQPGEQVLDIGCGGGAGTIECARIVGDVEGGGHVTGVDISDALLYLAHERAAAAKVHNITFVQADAQTDPFPGEPFDVATSKFGVMFFDDPLAAFTNIRRHVKADGRLAFACFQSGTRNAWHAAATLQQYAPPPAPLRPGQTRPGPFSLGDANATTTLLERAGFTRVAHTDFEVVAHGDASLVYDVGQLAGFGIPPERRAEATAAMDEHLARYATGDGEYAFPLEMRTWTADAG